MRTARHLFHEYWLHFKYVKLLEISLMSPTHAATHTVWTACLFLCGTARGGVVRAAQPRGEKKKKKGGERERERDGPRFESW